MVKQWSNNGQTGEDDRAPNGGIPIALGEVHKKNKHKATHKTEVS